MSGRRAARPVARARSSAHGGVRVTLANCQRDARVPVAWLRRVTDRAVRQLRIRGPGVMAISLIDRHAMTRLNRRLLGHHGLTDVLSFRYDGEAIIGEVLVSPAFARRYAEEHGLVFREELARYVVHGLLHWLGHDDHTTAEQRRMRRMEDAVLRPCTADP